MVELICRNCGHDVRQHDQTKPKEQRENGFCTVVSRFQDRCECDNADERINVDDKDGIIKEIDKTIFDYQNILFEIMRIGKKSSMVYESAISMRFRLITISEKVYWLTYWIRSSSQ